LKAVAQSTNHHAASYGNRPTRLLIDLDALRHNLGQVRKKAGPKARIMAVVKANAYGLGAVNIARTLQEAGADCFGVACCGEGVELRMAGIDLPIVILGGLYPGEGELVGRYDLVPVVFSRENLALTAQEARTAGARFRVHLKIDTGMHRIGVKLGEAGELCEQIRREGVLELEGVMSHLATVEPQMEGYAGKQIESFRLCTETLKQGGALPEHIHIANSGAIVCASGELFETYRPGIVLFGSMPSETLAGRMDVRPVAKLVTEVMQVKAVPAGEPVSYGGTFVTQRDSTLAVVPLGYGDGYSRLLSNRGHILVRGRRAPVAGTVCMDMTVIDVTDIEGVRPGDEAVALGRQEDGEITIEEIAEGIGTIPYEILTSIGPRVPRIYMEKSREK